MKDLAGRLPTGEDEAHLPKLKSYQGFGRSSTSPAFIGGPLARHMVVPGKDCFRGEQCGNPAREGAGWGRKWSHNSFCFFFFFVKFLALDLELVWEETG